MRKLLVLATILIAGLVLTGGDYVEYCIRFDSVDYGYYEQKCSAALEVHRPRMAGVVFLALTATVLTPSRHKD